MGKNIIVCLDGTANEPERAQTNVARTFDMLVRDPGQQLTYYDPGVGTMGARSANSRAGRFMTRIGGLLFGHGIEDNLAEAYQYLMETFKPGDRIFLFGFSRGAYTTRALAGLLRTVGLLEAGAANLIPYALKLYTGAPREGASKKKQDEFWENVQKWNDTFGNPAFERFARPIHFMGVWDTVKFVGWFNLLGRFRQAKWPFTRNVDAVFDGRHAVSIDERRTYYAAYPFASEQVASSQRQLKEVWFAGVHSDIGGGFPEHGLADITLRWIVDEALDKGLLVHQAKYIRHVGAPKDQPLSARNATDRIHPASRLWFVLGAGWRVRKIPAGSMVHGSVKVRMDNLDGYRPRLPASLNWVQSQRTLDE